MPLPVTLTMAAACAVLNLWLAARVVPGRLKGVSLGDGGDARMLATTRAHANFAEYAPIVLILLGAIELAGGSPVILWALGALFVAGRVAHAFGMLRPVPNALRAGGILTTWLVTAALAGWAVTIAYSATRAPVVTFTPAEAPKG